MAHGTTLIELLVVLSLLIVAVGATPAFLDSSTREQRREQAFGQEITGTQTALARLTHDLRSATRIAAAAPNAIEFLLRDSSGTTFDIRYDCSLPDSLGGNYTRCGRVQSANPSPPACDEIYQDTVAGIAPPYVQVVVRVPASGDLPSGGLTHTTSSTRAPGHDARRGWLHAAGAADRGHHRAPRRASEGERLT